MLMFNPTKSATSMEMEVEGAMLFRIIGVSKLAGIVLARGAKDNVGENAGVVNQGE
jgi:hypothetical protein